MTIPLELPTEQETVRLRQLTIADAPAYFAAVDSNRDHLSQFGEDTNSKYPDLASVVASIANPTDPNRLRLGIWDKDTFVGSANLTPDEYGAEIGYWLDSRHTHKGYATLATRALAHYAAGRYPHVHAEVTEGNEASVRVLERAGFRQMAAEAGRLVFELINRQPPRKISLEDTTSFERDGFTGHTFIPKEAELGFSAMQIDVHGSHPRKRMLEGTTRSYYVVDGEGTFTLGNATHTVAKGDVFVIPPGGEYEYRGEMTLFEFNVSPDNSFQDQKLEQEA
jgi:RimJ/RimL family protein N-acetyltransferase/mannose-6-phosphate isomerase-like protein (cupin superfamily)